MEEADTRAVGEAIGSQEGRPRAARSAERAEAGAQGAAVENRVLREGLAHESRSGRIGVDDQDQRDAGGEGGAHVGKSFSRRQMDHLE